MKFACPCCGYYTYPVPPAEDVGYICPVCFWENDPFEPDPGRKSDSNRGMTLDRARENFRAEGACAAEFLKYVRPPAADELCGGGPVEPGMEPVARLFLGWDETMVWSCLQGCMGAAETAGGKNPVSARIELADFAFFAGRPDEGLVKSASAAILTPRTEEWAALIERTLGSDARRATRYAIKKSPGVFDPARLRAMTVLPPEYELRLFDAEVYRLAMAESWSRDFCAQFSDGDDYVRRGVGAAVLREGKLASGASAYSVWLGGAEIEIDTLPEFRRRGLASACGAAMILECLRRGLYPSWDAHDLRSVALAEKLGYSMDKAYTVIERG